MRSAFRRAGIFAAASSFFISVRAQGGQNGCCAEWYYPSGGETYNNIDTVIASWSSNYPTANLTLYCLNPGNSYTYKTWTVDSTGTFKFSHFTSDVAIDQYPSTCHIELDNIDALSNYYISPNFILTDIAGVSVNTFSTDPPTSTPTTAVITTTAPGTTQTIISTASPTVNDPTASPSFVTSTSTSNPTTITSSATIGSSLSFTPITSTQVSASTANDVAASGASGSTTVGAASASSSGTPDPSSSGLSTGAKAGIGAGAAIVGLALIGGLIYLFAMRKKLKRAENRASMYQARAESPPPVNSIGRASWAPVPQSDTFSDKQSVSATTATGYALSNDTPTSPMMGYSAVPGYDAPQELGANEASYGMRHHELP